MADHSGRKQGGGSQVSNTPFNAITPPPPIQSLPTTVSTTSEKTLTLGYLFIQTCIKPYPYGRFSSFGILARHLCFIVC